MIPQKSNKNKTKMNLETKIALVSTEIQKLPFTERVSE